MTEQHPHSSPVPSKFRTILVDPPWPTYQGGGRGAARHYPLMSLERIMALPVADLAEEDAHLWLWTTNATLRFGYDVAEAYGFTVRSPLTWVKFYLGLGHYLRNSSETLLFATRGKAPVRFRSQPTWINAPVQDHSHKPEEQYAVIERVSEGPYLELFARRRPSSNRPWFVWGDEVAADITIPGYPVPSDRKRTPKERPGE
ncbi:MT-A70 family methyltransferase [Thermomonospora umbrina]|uniref:N6-adenosine-specific RNA methylase IME4 n=1 Tax=Thermomonospora umbrina TaxID=111806 RepID=A0A3D9SP64_9ACTN|nr:MT-A70 family methyltransferase [Thermomonospora umbrina]REE94735.1 N6-adenosine-specific RNA methylase IME4 [Thermomonospora umbrina]